MKSTKRKKICVITGTRAEYGLLCWIMQEIRDDSQLQLQVIVTGMHLSPEFGMTIEYIKRDGYPINEKVEMLLSSDSPVGITKSIGIGILGFADSFSRLKPDLLLVLGDRFEVLAACTAAVVARIPIAHIHGGESTEGLIDEPIRHAVTKMSHFHFVSTDLYRKRVIQMGEHPGRVFNYGAPGLENLDRLKLMSRSQMENFLQRPFAEKNILVTFHPVTLEKNTAGRQFKILLNVLDELEDVFIVFTKPNSDTEGRIISTLIDHYVQKNKQRTISFTNLGRLRYLSLLKQVDMVVGNSSSGIIEVPSFKIPTINIGDRQKNRIMPKSVINCEPMRQSILSAIQKGFSRIFQKSISKLLNPYYQKNTSKKIKNKIKSLQLGEVILKKHFYDLNFRA